ncbi:zinc finger domain-containing protein [Streptomyces uncialis]|uniref:zinc finger domain-containing protein n=1 Tax=Streptomyces uncialis TaxID=1048205 RepID=UPI00093C4F13|nr:hypothetical protein [Streptomyces uncialis]
MIPSQTAELLSFAAAFDRRTIGEADVLAWQTVLADIDFNAARQAVTAHYATETRWIMPADIRQAVRRHRSATADSIHGPGLPAEIPDADPDDVPAYLAAVREQRTRAADGQQLRRRPIAELVAGIGRPMPDGRGGEPSPVRRAGPLGRECPACAAPIGRPCRTGRDRERAPHEARITATLRESA